MVDSTFAINVIHSSFYFMFTLVNTHSILFKGFVQYEIDFIHIKETHEKVVRLGRTFFGLSNLFYIFLKSIAIFQTRHIFYMKIRLL